MAYIFYTRHSRRQIGTENPVQSSSDRPSRGDRSPVREHVAPRVNTHMHIHALSADGTHWHPQREVRAQTQSRITSLHPSLSLFSHTHTHGEDKPAQSINIFTLQAVTFQANHLSLHPPVSLPLHLFHPHLPYMVHFVKQRRRPLPNSSR